MPLKSTTNFFEKNIRENLNRLFIHEVTYKRKLIRHWTVLVKKMLVKGAATIFTVREKSIKSEQVVYHIYIYIYRERESK